MCAVTHVTTVTHNIITWHKLYFFWAPINWQFLSCTYRVAGVSLLSIMNFCWRSGYCFTFNRWRTKEKKGWWWTRRETSKTEVGCNWRWFRPCWSWWCDGNCFTEPSTSKQPVWSEAEYSSCYTVGISTNYWTPLEWLQGIRSKH